jgi:hypothetical protein
VTVAAVLLTVGVAAGAYGAEPRSDLDLYMSSLLAGIHSHPVGLEGRRLERAERALDRRRATIREWLVSRLGEAAVAEQEAALHEEVSSVYWVRGPTLDEEWAWIGRARRNLGRLERRRRQAQRSN